MMPSFGCDADGSAVMILGFIAHAEVACRKEHTKPCASYKSTYNYKYIGHRIARSARRFDVSIVSGGLLLTLPLIYYECYTVIMSESTKELSDLLEQQYGTIDAQRKTIEDMQLAVKEKDEKIAALEKGNKALLEAGGKKESESDPTTDALAKYKAQIEAGVGKKTKGEK